MSFFSMIIFRFSEMYIFMIPRTHPLSSPTPCCLKLPVPASLPACLLSHHIIMFPHHSPRKNGEGHKGRKGEREREREGGGNPSTRPSSHQMRPSQYRASQSERDPTIATTATTAAALPSSYSEHCHPGMVWLEHWLYVYSIFSKSISYPFQSNIIPKLCKE